MSFIDKLDKETIESADEFIRDIKSGVYRKRIMKNSAEEYPIEKAMESFEHFVKSNASLKIKKFAGPLPMTSIQVPPKRLTASLPYLMKLCRNKFHKSSNIAGAISSLLNK